MKEKKLQPTLMEDDTDGKKEKKNNPNNKNIHPKRLLNNQNRNKNKNNDNSTINNNGMVTISIESEEYSSSSSSSSSDSEEAPFEYRKQYKPFSSSEKTERGGEEEEEEEQQMSNTRDLFRKMYRIELENKVRYQVEVVVLLTKQITEYSNIYLYIKHLVTIGKCERNNSRRNHSTLQGDDLQCVEYNSNR